MEQCVEVLVSLKLLKLAKAYRKKVKKQNNVSMPGE